VPFLRSGNMFKRTVCVAIGVGSDSAVRYRMGDRGGMESDPTPSDFI
jgi:hypothetical protein